MRNILILAACALLAPQPVPSSTIDAPAAAAMRWRLVGPFRGGRVVSAEGVPGQPHTYYFGAVGGGVWKTTDGGRVWNPVFDAEPVQSIGAIAIAPSNPDVIYVGTGEPDFRSDLSSGNGVYRSTDGGRSWQHLGLDDTRQIARIAIDPRNPDVALVAALGHAYDANADRGVFRTADGGRTWQKVLYKDDDTGAIDVVMQPSNPSIVYAALWSVRRTPWSRYPPVTAPGGGIFKSTDGGVTWRALTGNGLPTTVFGRTGLAVGYGNRGDRVYAIVDTDKAGLYRSDDAGSTWSLVGTDPRITSRAWYFNQVTVDPNDPDTVYVPNVGLNRSTDGGRTWTPIKGAPGGDDYHSLWIDPRDSSRMIAGVDQGATISVDGGSTWSSWYNQPTGQMYHVATDNAWPYGIYGSQQDSGTVGIASRGNYGAITPKDWQPVGAGESGYVVPDPDDPDVVYGGSTNGPMFRFDRRTGESQDISPMPEGGFGANPAAVRYRFTWTSPIVLSTTAPRAIYFGSQYVLKSTDQGHSWRAISPDLTRGGRQATPASGGPMIRNLAPAEAFGVVYTIALSRVSPGVIWAGTDDGLIHLTRDEGRHWQNVTPPPLDAWSKVSMIDASPHDAATAYAAIDRHRLDDRRPYIYRTHDYGATWTATVAGLPDGAFVRAVREDPVRQGLLFAATERGVFVSFDDGDRWQGLQMNLPHAPVHDLTVHGDDLVAATHGRAFWVLDDIAPLREVGAPSASGGGVRLLAPSTAIRVRRSVNTDTPLPPETPMGRNPPDGAIIDYSLPAAASEVTLEIADGAGTVVRRFSSRDVVPPVDTTQPFPTYWLSPARVPTVNAGMNRFVWDLRYAAPPVRLRDYTIAAIPGDTPALPEGPQVVPGRYEVRLTAGGATLTAPLTVKMDPRVSVSAADLRRQFDLEKQISDAIARTAAGLDAAAARGASDEAARHQEAELTRLNAALGALLVVVDTADAAPTQQALDLFARYSRELDAAL
ncbi:MAG TPA: hypothetical protein VFX12_09140 [Vicinamibacterales bacterium]|nr:hypothetical protein [Vicinamibacterales bacterium]